MIDEIIEDAQERMGKAITALGVAFNKIRTGRAHPAILDGIMVSYYEVDTPLSQLANIAVEEGRTLVINPWEKGIGQNIEKAIMKSDLGLNPSSAGDVIRVPMPALTEETRRDYIKQARAEAENSRISVRNIRRDAISDFKDLLKEKEISEDEERGAEERIQKVTDKFMADIEQALKVKEDDLMEI